MTGVHPDDCAGSAMPALVADVGGTYTRVALACGTKLLPWSRQRYINSGFANLEAVIELYLCDTGCRELAGGCLAVAGPVAGGRGTMTHLDWKIDAASLSAALDDSPVSVINDLQAVGHALHLLHADDFAAIVTGRPAVPGAARLAINVGTGFNAAAVHTTGAGLVVAPSESGHAGLPAAAIEDPGLMRHLEQAVGFVTIEDILSGRGAARARSWVTASNNGRQPPGGEEAAFNRIMATALGSIAGDLALIHLPYGGIYLTGGVVSAIAPHLKAHGFCEAFTAKGRFAGFMEQFPISLISDDACALRGCAARFFGL